MKFPEESGIYKICFEGCDKVYIGSTNNFRKRYASHLSSLIKLKHFNVLLQNDFASYGRLKFKFDIVEYCEQELLLIKEDFWVKQLNSTDPLFGYNRCSPLDNYWQRADKRSNEFKEKHAEMMRLKVWDKNKKLFRFVDPDGNLVEIYGLKQYCKEKGLHYATMCNLHRGCNFGYKGWRKFFEKDAPLRKLTTQFRIISSSGKIIMADGAKSFCKQHGIPHRIFLKGAICHGHRIIRRFCLPAAQISKDLHSKTCVKNFLRQSQGNPNNSFTSSLFSIKNEDDVSFYKEVENTKSNTSPYSRYRFTSSDA